MKTTLLNQIRDRRRALGLKIQDMILRAGVTRQQYGKIESVGNPRLNTLDQIAEGLDAALVLVPKDKLVAVQRLLDGEYPNSTDDRLGVSEEGTQEEFVNREPENPWGDLS